MKKHFNKSFRFMGRRGCSLLLLGFLYCMIAQELFFPPVPNIDLGGSFFDSMSLTAWGVLWLVPGIISLMAAFYRKLDILAFGLTAGMMIIWSFGYIDIGLHEGFRWWLGSAGIYWSLAAIIQLMAGWPEAPLALTKTDIEASLDKKTDVRQDE